jgi:type II secretion system protein J
MKEHSTFNIQHRTSKEAARCLGVLSVEGWWLNVSRQAAATTPGRRDSRSGFTLIEVLLAVAIFAIVLLAINAVFYSGVRLERTTTRALDARLPLNQAFAILRRDLLGAVPPLTNATMLIRDFKSGTGRSGLGSTASGSLEFYTTTGSLSGTEPWGDVQKVRYELVEATDRVNAKGKDLVRYVTRNILPTTTTTEDEVSQWLVGDLESIEFQCYSGSDWRTTWDTTAADVGLPQAVRVRVQLARDRGANRTTRDPIELLVPLTTQVRTNQTSQTSGGQGR